MILQLLLNYMIDDFWYIKRKWNKWKSMGKWDWKNPPNKQQNQHCEHPACCIELEGVEKEVQFYNREVEFFYYYKGNS